MHGYAHMYVAPNVCYIKFSSASTDKESASVAFKSNAIIMGRISEALKEAGVEEKDMQTLNIHLSPQYRYEGVTNKKFNDGYLVQQDLQVKIRDPSGLSQLLDTAVSAG